MPKVYLGDAVYADFDGYYIILTTEGDSPDPSNKIYLEPIVVEKLLSFLKSKSYSV